VRRFRLLVVTAVRSELFSSVQPWMGFSASSRNFSIHLGGFPPLQGLPGEEVPLGIAAEKTLLPGQGHKAQGPGTDLIVIGKTGFCRLWASASWVKHRARMRTTGRLFPGYRCLGTEGAVAAALHDFPLHQGRHCLSGPGRDLPGILKGEVGPAIGGEVQGLGHHHGQFRPGDYPFRRKGPVGLPENRPREAASRMACWAQCPSMSVKLGVPARATDVVKINAATRTNAVILRTYFTPVL